MITQLAEGNDFHIHLDINLFLSTNKTQETHSSNNFSFNIQSKVRYNRNTQLDLIVNKFVYSGLIAIGSVLIFISRLR